MMHKIVSKQNECQKKIGNVPLFIRQRSGCKSKDFSKRSVSKGNVEKEFKKIVVSDPSSVWKMRQRIQFWIKNTPVIRLVNLQKGIYTFSIQSPTKSLLQVLQCENHKTKLQKIYQIIKTLFKIVQIYGYFYCDKQMLKVSQSGDPVVWMNNNFCCLEREFPIKLSTVSELIFVKKLKSTLSEVFAFPKNIQIESKVQLVNFIDDERKKIDFLGENISKPQHQISHKEFGKVSIKQFSSYRSISPPNFRLFTKASTPKKNCHQNQTSSKSIHVDNRSEKSKTMKDLFNTNKRGKTSNLDHKLFFSGERKDNSSFDKSFSHHSDLPQTKLNQFRLYKTGFDNESSLTHKSQRMQQLEETISNQFNFDQEFISYPKPLNSDKKSRKQSADVKLVQTWLKGGDNQSSEKNFQNSTFSTRVTFSSVKGEFEVCDIEYSKCKTNLTKDNYVIPHLYSNSKQKETKEKLNADIRKIMKESGYKIAEEDSFENEVQNLFDSESKQDQRKKKSKMRESQLVKQFEKLFTSQKSEAPEESFTADFQDILG